MKIRITLTIGCILLILLLADCGVPSPSATVPAPSDTPLPTPAAEPATPPVERPTATSQDEESVHWVVPAEGWQEHASAQRGSQSIRIKLLW